jgi:uncharacterized protein YjiS (DUF1127 family)
VHVAPAKSELSQEKKMTDIAYFRRSAFAEHVRLSSIDTIAKAVVEVLREWRRRARSRKELAMYSYHERNDIRGAAQVDAEIMKPFWQK